MSIYDIYDIKELVLGPTETNCWIVVYGPSENNSYLCALIDPGAEPDTIMALLTPLVLRPSYILLTHGHYDHILAVPDMYRAFPDAIIGIHRDDLPYLGPDAPRLNGRSLGIGDNVSLPKPGEGIQLLDDGDCVGPFKVLSTPGHTPGSLSFLLERERILFSGDTLFKGGCGRTDLPGGDQGKMEQSLKRLLVMIGNTHVLPGHGEFTTIYAEQKTKFF
jgi:glyoxylase-like metal-dependent hydrolase (beta-lactamase superfamily II)